MRVGDKVKLDGDRCRWTVQALDTRFVVLTRAHFADYWYTIVDREERVRGPINFIFGPPIDGEVNTPEGALELLEVLRTDPSAGVSHRNRLPLTKSEFTDA